MKTFKEFLKEKPETYSVWSVNSKGVLGNRENLNANELDQFMYKIYGKYSNIKVQASNGNVVMYTDDGTEWKATKKIKGKR
jgi:hypothetical protein